MSNINFIPSNLGKISIDGEIHEIATIKDFPTGKQEVEIVDSKGQKRRIVYYKPDYDFNKNY